MSAVVIVIVIIVIIVIVIVIVIVNTIIIIIIIAGNNFLVKCSPEQSLTVFTFLFGQQCNWWSTPMETELRLFWEEGVENSQAILILKMKADLETVRTGGI